MMPKVLVAEISGKRPGDKSKRPTEKYSVKYDHVIISNNSEGYVTEWPIINVPADYVTYYKDNHKQSENAWYAPMNRSYAIKYAREHGYDYLIQLDDNIIKLEIGYLLQKGGKTVRFREQSGNKMMDDFISMLVCVLQNTNAAMAGFELAGSAMPHHLFLRERFVYSFFGLNLSICPAYFQGDFEDDIEYRYKCAELGFPVVMICPFRYGKTGQHSNKDESGNRAAYTQAGLKRGANMSLLHGDQYRCGFTKKTASTMSQKEGKFFKHEMKPFQLGVMVKDPDAIKGKFLEIVKKYARTKEDKAVVKIKHKTTVNKNGK